MKYFAQRLIRAWLLLVGVSLLCFAFTELAPGNFFDEMRLNPQISTETISRLQARYGLNQPLAVRYFRWVGSITHGDFGYSLAYNTSVAPLLWARAKNTLLLTSTALILTWCIGLPLGIWTASCRAKVFDRVTGTATSLLLATPEIVIAIILLALAVRSRIVPVGGMLSLDAEDLAGWAKVQDVCLHMLLPVCILVLGSFAIIERHIRAGVVEALDMPCIQAARALGIGTTRLLIRHVLPLAVNPAISLFGFSLGGLLGGSLLVEVITGWPGLGPLMLDATLSRDIDVVIGAAVLVAVFTAGGNLISDLLLPAFDPRISAGEHRA